MCKKMEKRDERTEDIDVETLLAEGRDLERIANAKREVESMRLAYNIRQGLMQRLDAKERQIIAYMHLDDEKKKGGSEQC